MKSPAEDRPADALPAGYGGLGALQAEFRRYQNAAFPHRSSRFFALELAGETGELANLEKKAWKGRAIRDEDFADESADVCIALLNYANSRGIDLAGAVGEKMKRIDDRRREEALPAAEPAASQRSGGARAEDEDAARALRPAASRRSTLPGPGRTAGRPRP